MSELTDEEMLALICDKHIERVLDSEREVFPDMLDRVREGRALTRKQRNWIRAVADRLNVQTAPARNVFTEELADAQRREHLARAAKVVMPWEQPGYKRALKPPGR